MKTLIVIDRFEGDFVVCEKANKEMVNIERSKVPLESPRGRCIGYREMKL